MNKWKNIWEKRSVDAEKLSSGDIYSVFEELKRADGFDVVDGQMSREAMVKQYEETKKQLFGGCCKKTDLSVYEVGCGSGANLYLFEHDNIKCGGIDYSEKQINIAKSVLNSKDIVCGEAADMPDVPCYTAVLSNSVFSYFPNYEYAQCVLEKMYKKAEYSIVLIDIHDIEKKEAFKAYRRATIENYDKLYEGLDKFFYDKSFFEKFARSKNMDIVFSDSDVDGYWNNEFVFNCCMYKKQ